MLDIISVFFLWVREFSPSIVFIHHFFLLFRFIYVIILRSSAFISFVSFIRSIQQRSKPRHWLERYHFVVSTLVLGLKIEFDQQIKWMEFQKLAEIKWLPVNLWTREYAKYGVTYTGKSASIDCLCFCQILGHKRRHWYLQTYKEWFPYLLPFSRYLPGLYIFLAIKSLQKLVLLKQ